MLLNRRSCVASTAYTTRRLAGGGTPGGGAMSSDQYSSMTMGEKACVCPELSDQDTCLNVENNVWKPFEHGELVTVANVLRMCCECVANLLHYVSL